MARILIAGATGLVGRHAVDLALTDPRVTAVVAPTRRPLPANPKLDNPVLDFGRLPEHAPFWAVDGAISALGTTIRKAGSQEAFRAVDHRLVVAIARLARAGGAHRFALTSAAGAKAGSRIFYNRVKGETEEALMRLSYPSLTILRPSLIGGERQEARPAEQAALQVFRALAPVIPRRWRIVEAEAIARRLLDAALAAPPGVHVVESDAIG